VVAAAVAIAQYLAEGPRWQMVPAYVLSGFFLLLWLRQYMVHQRVVATRSSAVHRVVAAIAISLGTLVIALAAALPAMIPVFRFPPPTGPYGIGTVIYHWHDDTRPEIVTADPGDKRELMVQVWYPARKGAAPGGASYANGADFTALARLMHLPPFFFDHLRYVTTNAEPSAAMADEPARFPVLIFSPGRGGYRGNSTFLVEWLVSHGYVVAGIDHPYTVVDVAFPDGRHVTLDRRIARHVHDEKRDPFMEAVYHQIGADAVFVLRQLGALDEADPNGPLNGRLDLQRAGMLGTSLGGIATAEACRLEPRLRACLPIDVAMPHSVVDSGLQQPTMWITGTEESKRREGWTPSSIREHMNTMRAVFTRLPADGYLVTVATMFHPDIGDTPYIVPPPLGTAMNAVGQADWRRTHAIINAYSLAFFDKYLQGSSEPLLDTPAQAYPEVRLERR